VFNLWGKRLNNQAGPALLETFEEILALQSEYQNLTIHPSGRLALQSEYQNLTIHSSGGNYSRLKTHKKLRKFLFPKYYLYI
jgi:hypothetical protein